MKTKRNSNLEILRIIAMLLIVIHHFGVHGLEIKDATEYTYNFILIEFLKFPGKLGVDLFIIISAWFMTDSKFNYKKFIKLFGQVWFYSIGILLIFLFVLEPVEEIGIKDIIKSVFPVLLSRYWFITDYVLLMVLSPFLNIVINKFDRGIYEKMLITLVVLNILVSGTYTSFLPDMSTGLITFIDLYFIVAYIKKYTNFEKNSYKKNLMLATLSILVFFITVVAFSLVGYKFNIKFFINKAGTFGKANNIITVFTAIELFLVFLKLPAYSNKVINKIASGTLGVYLIHDNPLMRPYLWKIIFKTPDFLYSKYLILYAIGCTLIIYIVCTIIDLIRQTTVEKIWLKVAPKIYDKAEELVKFFVDLAVRFLGKIDVI